LNLREGVSGRGVPGAVKAEEIPRSVVKRLPYSDKIRPQYLGLRLDIKSETLGPFGSGKDLLSQESFLFKGNSG